MSHKAGRKKTRSVLVRGVRIGGGAPISVQTMTKVPARDWAQTLDQVLRAKDAGADIVRLSVPDDEALAAFGRVRKATAVPLVADIHFDYRLALGAIGAGADKLRINPGNIGGRERLIEVANAAKERGCPIRVGVNAGSLEKDLLLKYGGPTPEAIAESALRSAGLLADLAFQDIVISAKSSSVMDTILAYRRISSVSDYPLHVGITETGFGLPGTVKSAVGIGALLADGIGDTIRVSLTAPPEEEVIVGREILKSLELLPGLNFVSCPTCGRSHEGIFGLAGKVRELIGESAEDMTIAVMGCEVNGPGEAREADFGMALTKSGAMLFEKGKVVSTGEVEDVVSELVNRVRKGR